MYHAIQFMWAIAAIDPRARMSLQQTNIGTIIGQHLWIVTSLSIFLQSQSFESIIVVSLDPQIDLLSSAIAGMILRLLASLVKWNIELNWLRSESEVKR